jgi:hypothetical protein
VRSSNAGGWSEPRNTRKTRNTEQLAGSCVGLFNLPFLDACGPAGLQRYLEAQACRGYRLELDLVKSILLSAERLGRVDWFPVLSVAIENSPGSGQTALTGAGVIKPVNLSVRDPRRTLERILDPFLGSFPWPPMEEKVFAIIGGSRIGLGQPLAVVVGLDS